MQATIYLAGDSTMVDQDVEPWASWGQQLPRFFQTGVVVANHAESGESSSSFVGEQRMAKILSPSLSPATTSSSSSPTTTRRTAPTSPKNTALT